MAAYGCGPDQMDDGWVSFVAQEEPIAPRRFKGWTIGPTCLVGRVPLLKIDYRKRVPLF